MLEKNMPVTITKAGTVKNCYLLITEGIEFKRPARIVPKRRGEVITVSSAYLKSRYGIRA